jgi:hypothetical protein
MQGVHAAIHNRIGNSLSCLLPALPATSRVLRRIEPITLPAYAAMFNGYVEMNIMVEALPIYFKLKRRSFFPAWTYTLPPVLIRIPWSIVDSLIWSLVVYW